MDITNRLVESERDQMLSSDRKPRLVTTTSFCVSCLAAVRGSVLNVVEHAARIGAQGFKAPIAHDLEKKSSNTKRRNLTEDAQSSSAAYANKLARLVQFGHVYNAGVTYGNPAVRGPGDRKTRGTAL